MWKERNIRGNFYKSILLSCIGLLFNLKISFWHLEPREIRQNIESGIATQFMVIFKADGVILINSSPDCRWCISDDTSWSLPMRWSLADNAMYFPMLVAGCDCSMDKANQIFIVQPYSCEVWRFSFPLTCSATPTIISNAVFKCLSSVCGEQLTTRITYESWTTLLVIMIWPPELTAS